MASSGEIQRNLIQRVNVGDSLTRSAARYPDRTALVDGARRFSYREFNSLVNRFAHGLAERGYTRGDALALASGNSAEFLVTYYACAKLGVVCVPVNLGWRPDEVAYVLGHSKARGIVIEAQLLPVLGETVAAADGVTDVIVAPGTGEDTGDHLPFSGVCSANDAEPDAYVEDRDPISYLYTSGTTSAPKGVVGNHTAIYLESLSVAVEARYDESDRFVAMMPMFHTAQLNAQCTAAVMVGAATYVMRSFDAGALLDLIETESITQIFGLPMMFRAMLDHPSMADRDVSSLRRALYAMATMPEAQLRECLDTFGCDFFLLFGQTEMSPVSTLFRPEHQLSHPGAVGTPVANVQVGIMDETGKLLPRGSEGEIVYRGPHTLSEYLDNPGATEAVFEHGWFHSGDVGRVDDDGMLWFTDRRKDVIKTGGENVASVEVEKAIYAASPDVAEAVVVGLPHERWTEAITAIVTPRPGAEVNAGELARALRAHLDPYKIPKAIVVAGELPRTSTGKIQKNVLRSRYAGFYDDSPER
ncbi:MAG: AMP-binding protein [Streptosporangiales bacterium]|jgi:acyl-CoA synthetase (AMP-forming)/AMP-acid ligase II|nr:AMP-binding protein [Streptosporangiales bacterium]